MKLLRLSFHKQSPWARRVETEVDVRLQECIVCKTEEPYFSGAARVELEGGRKWPDVIGGDGQGYSRLLISERVLQTLQDYKISGFEAFPAEFTTIESRALREASHSKYYILYSHAGLAFDDDLLGRIPDQWLCQGCKKTLKKSAPEEYRKVIFDKIRRRERLEPIVQSWSGKDIFLGTNGPRGFYCSEKLIKLAHEHRWTNFRFDMIDAVERHVIRWEGINYLSKKWPPERWYPPAPSDGKTMVEWLDVLRSEPCPHGCRFEINRASEALLDFGEQVVPSLLEMLDEESATVRRNAAGQLAWSHGRVGIPLTDDVRSRIVEVWPELEVSVLK